MHRLALGGLFGPILFMLIIAVAAFLRPGYSHIDNFISELGATGTPYAWLMNYGGFVPTGLLLIAFGISLIKRLPQNRLTLVVSSLALLFGAGVAASGLISCDPGCPQVGGTFENFIHDKIAPISFLCLIIATGILGIYFRKLTVWRALWLYSIITSIIALCFLLVLVNSLESRVLIGLWQRLMLATLFLWCMIVGVHAFRQA